MDDISDAVSLSPIKKPSLLKQGQEVRPSKDNKVMQKPNDPKIQQQQPQDAVTISAQSSEANKMRQWVDALKKMPDIRDDVVSAASQRMANASHPSTEALKKVVEGIKQDLGLNRPS